MHFPKSCLHCEEPACVTVCPTGASYKRAEDGIVLVNEDLCIGCKLCSWACPYGAREFDEDVGVMKKCTLCIDRIYNENLDEVDRVPACVSACPVGARHFGDLGDPEVAGLAAGGRARRLRPDAGARLPADQQVPAAAPGRAQAGCDWRRPKPLRGAARGSATGTELLRWRRPAAPLIALMHPALSVILFTTASGAGYGLLALLGLFGAQRRAVGGAAVRLGRVRGVAGLVTVGLLSSTLHLGHPERAWRAFSQWRSSWLSREGVLAVFTFLPAGIYADRLAVPRRAVGVGGPAAQRQRVRDGRARRR